MMNDAVGKRIEKILTDIQSRKKVDYACRNDVSRYNRAYSRIVRNIRYIDDHYPDQIHRITEFLSSSDLDIVSHIAPIVITLKSCSLEEKKRAIAILEGLLENEQIDQVDKMMLSTNLVKWRAEVFGQ